jgi:hypothetical protein
VRASIRIRVCTGASILLSYVEISSSSAGPVDLAPGSWRGDLFCRGVRLPRQPVEVGDPGAVDQLVHDLGHDDLAPQRVVVHLRPVAVPHLAREVAEQLAAQERVVGQVALEQLVGEHDLRVGQQHRQLRRGQPALALDPLGDLLARGRTPGPG